MLFRQRLCRGRAGRSSCCYWTTVSMWPYC